jgi:hypothetical protein
MELLHNKKNMIVTKIKEDIIEKTIKDNIKDNIKKTIKDTIEETIKCSCGAVGKSSYLKSQKHLNTIKHINKDKICKTEWKVLTSNERDSYNVHIKTCKSCSQKLLPYLVHREIGGDYYCLKCNNSVDIVYLCHQCKWNGCHKYIFEDDDEDIE